MAMQNPKGRVNYEPNSWERDENNPRACPEHGYKSTSEEVSGSKLRYRSETFADHYSQAIQFYKSQTEVEQAHMQNALVFELSKVEHLKIRERVVSHLLNIDKDLAEGVAKGLGLKSLPEAAEAAMKPKANLKVSDALSILKNAPNLFKGRKLGILATDGLDDKLFEDVKKSLTNEGAMFEIIAPTVNGVDTDKGNFIEGDQVIDGGPSVLYDAVLLLVTKEGAEELAKVPEAKDFVMDAFAHNKFIGYTDAAMPLFDETNLSKKVDDGFINLGNISSDDFVSQLRQLRFWQR